MKAIDILKKARSLIAIPDAWTKRLMRNANGDFLCYCALGAVMEAAPDGLADLEAEKACGMLAMALPKEHHTTSPGEMDRVAIYNDAPRTTHRDILRVFDKAIRRATA